MIDSNTLLYEVHQQQKQEGEQENAISTWKSRNPNNGNLNNVKPGFRNLVGELG